jgi:hypothetical protein
MQKKNDRMTLSENKNRKKIRMSHPIDGKSSCCCRWSWKLRVMRIGKVIVRIKNENNESPAT